MKKVPNWKNRQWDLNANHANFLMVYVYIIHIGRHPLFALMLPDWQSMHYILNCSLYLKYRLRVSLRFNLSWHDFAANITCRNNWSTLVVVQIIAYTVVIHGRLDTRVETRCPEGVNISCLPSRSRHFSYSEIVFSFQVLMKFSLEILVNYFKNDQW